MTKAAWYRSNIQRTLPDLGPCKVMTAALKVGPSKSLPMEVIKAVDESLHSSIIKDRTNLGSAMK